MKSQPKQPKRLPALSIEDFEQDDLHRLADDLLKWFDENEDEPVLRAFFAHRNISNNLVKQMIDANEYFAAVYEIALAKQESRIIKWGLKSKNAMPIFLLKALHGYSDNPQPEEIDDHILVNNFPSDEEMEQAREALKDDRQRDAMLMILQAEEREKQFKKHQEGGK